MRVPCDRHGAVVAAISAFALVAAACSLVALRTKQVWLDTLAAAVLLAMAPVFLWMHLRGLSG